MQHGLRFVLGCSRVRLEQRVNIFYKGCSVTLDPDQSELSVSTWTRMEAGHPLFVSHGTTLRPDSMTEEHTWREFNFYKTPANGIPSVVAAPVKGGAIAAIARESNYKTATAPSCQRLSGNIKQLHIFRPRETLARVQEISRCIPRLRVSRP